MAKQNPKTEESKRNPIIMIVDDEEIVLQSLTSYLTLETDYELLTFQSPRQALEELGKGRKVDIVISDFLMPQMNGLEFLKEVKKIYPDIPRIILTGYADKENAINAINEVGLYQYIEKPWDNENIRLVIRNGLQNKSLSEVLTAKLRELDQVLLHRDKLAQRDHLLTEELSMARKLQDNMLPEVPYTRQNIQVSARYKPALEIGGDFFDIINLKGDRIAILIADATGHGIQAALSTMLLKFAFSSFIDKDVNPVDILRGMNKVLHRVLPVDIFVAAMVVTFNVKNGQGSVANGGIPHPFIIHQNGGDVEQVTINGLILGVADEDTYEPEDEYQFELNSNEKLILYTDGLSEIDTDDVNHLQTGQIIEILSQNTDSSLDDILDILLKESENCSNNSQQMDDITVVGIAANGN
jgi:serine phosphatase RsbU (regulator of sigma subunit)